MQAGMSQTKPGRERKVFPGKGPAFAKAWRWNFIRMKVEPTLQRYRLSLGTTNARFFKTH